MNGAPIVISDPVVSYRETVADESTKIVMSKSPEQAQPPLLQGHAARRTEPRRGSSTTETSRRRDDQGARAVLVEKFGWDKRDAKKIWCFGPDTHRPNLVVDSDQGVQYLNEIKDSVRRRLPVGCQGGPALRGEPARAQSDITTSCCTRMPSTVVAARSSPRAAASCTRPCSPRAAPAGAGLPRARSSAGERLGGIYSTSRRSAAWSSRRRSARAPRFTTSRRTCPSWSPSASPDFAPATAGQAFPQCVFDHWDMLGPIRRPQLAELEASSWTSQAQGPQGVHPPAQRVRGQALRVRTRRMARRKAVCCVLTASEN